MTETFGHCTVIVALPVTGSSLVASAVPVFGSVPPTHSTPVGVVPLTTWSAKLAPGARSFGPQAIVWDGAVPLMTQLAPRTGSGSTS